MAGGQKRGAATQAATGDSQGASEEPQPTDKKTRKGSPAGADNALTPKKGTNEVNVHCVLG